MAVPENLHPTYTEKFLNAMKAERAVKRITFDRTEAILLQNSLANNNSSSLSLRLFTNAILVRRRRPSVKQSLMTYSVKNTESERDQRNKKK